jgi:hypothetical protein
MPSAPAAVKPVACQLLPHYSVYHRATYHRYIGSTGSPPPSSLCPCNCIVHTACSARSNRGHCRDTPIYRDSTQNRRRPRRAFRLVLRHRSGSLLSSIAVLKGGRRKSEGTYNMSARAQPAREPARRTRRAPYGRKSQSYRRYHGLYACRCRNLLSECVYVYPELLPRRAR